MHSSILTVVSLLLDGMSYKSCRERQPAPIWYVMLLLNKTQSIYLGLRPQTLDPTILKPKSI